MNITVIGMGNAGTTIGADLSNKGHKVTLLKTSHKMHNDHYERLLKERTVHVDDLSNSYDAKIDLVTDDYDLAIKGADVIIIFVQTNYHETVIKQIVPHLSDGQCVIIEPGYLSTCFFLNNTSKDITIIEAESSPIDCRITQPGTVKVLFKNVMNPFGVYPKRKRGEAVEILDKLGYPFLITKNVIEAALHNPNLIVHTVGAIFSIPRIEYSKGNYWMYREVFTPHVWNLVEELDNEKMSILQKLGCEKMPYVEACKLRNSKDSNANALDVFKEYAQNSSPFGPSVPDSRYITEDVPQGLVLLESLGSIVDVPTPTATGLINCASAALRRDFRKEGRTVQALNEHNIRMILEDDSYQSL